MYIAKGFATRKKEKPLNEPHIAQWRASMHDCVSLNGCRVKQCCPQKSPLCPICRFLFLFMKIMSSHDKTLATVRAMLNALAAAKPVV